jgi:hypothetical protein
VSVPVVALETVLSGGETHLVPTHLDMALCGVVVDLNDPLGSPLTCRQCAGRLPEEA